ncbi:hypothetical protein GCM10027586_18710 [Kineococcus gypseus]
MGLGLRRRDERVRFEPVRPPADDEDLARRLWAATSAVIGSEPVPGALSA